MVRVADLSKSREYTSPIWESPPEQQKVSVVDPHAHTPLTFFLLSPISLTLVIILVPTLCDLFSHQYRHYLLHNA